MLQNDRSNDVKFVFDEKIVEEIARHCSSPNVKKTIAYLRLVAYHTPDKFICCIVDNVCFFAGTFAKTHFRLLEIAVKETEQKKGYGKILMGIMKNLCQQKQINKITFRTSKSENAKYFFLKYGAKLIGEKGEDYEMEINYGK